ncbi:hypothetical protein Tco_1445080 [Tanacetum coccineum]
MLNKDNYFPWSSRLLRYAKRKPTRKLLVNSIIHGLPEDIYAGVDRCNTAQEIWLRVQQIMKGSDIGLHTQTPYNYPVFHPDQPSQITYKQQPQPNNNYVQQPPFNINYMQQPMQNPEDISDPTTAMNMALVLVAKAFKLKYSTPTNNKQIISSYLRNRQITQLSMNMDQDRQMRMVRGNGRN